MKLIILDRDGVINYDSPNYIKSPDEWLPIPGSLSAIAALTHAGYKVAVATNQSGIGRGYYSVQTLQAIHHKMQQAVNDAGGAIDKIAYCPHLPTEGCQCRKPKPGLLHEIAEHFGCSFQQVIMIGDKLTDIEAAKAVGAQPILVRTHFDDIALPLDEHADVLIYTDLAEAVAALLAQGIQ